MTCPCRGDLCNGVNTEREAEAFGILPRLVAKTHNARIKRALISKSSFISMNNNRKNQIDNTTAQETKSIPNDNNATEEVMQNIDNQIDDATAMNAQIIETTATIIAESSNDKSEMSETKPTVDAIDKTSPVINNAMDSEIVVSNEHGTKETIIQIDIPSENIESSDLKTDIILMSSEATNHNNDEKASIEEIQTATPDMNKQSEEITMAETTTKATTVVMEEKEEKVKPSEQLPTAEALQHNDTPTTKSTEQMTMGTTMMTLAHIDMTTTEETKPRNNTAVRFDAHILTLVVGIILQY